jgi:phospholipid/cholesterol/gamma-HCH transport system substrate-binding protein
MSKKANPTSIGIFIFIGLLLGVCGLLLFTSTKLFTPTAKFIIYFDSSLSGLNEGAPVKYRGVTIGSVSRVMIHFNQATNDTAMPVIIELRDDLIRRRLEGATIFKSVAHLGEEIRKGLRARLETESLVTGVLYVDLERENSPPPAEYHQLEPVYVEIPSRPTDIQALMKNLAKLDLSGLEQRLSSLVGKLDTVLDRIKLDELMGSLTNLLNSANHVVGDPELTNAFTSLNETLHEFRLLGTRVNNRIDPLADDLTKTLAELNRALAQTRGGMQNFRDLLAADSSLRNELNVTLNRLAEASESVSTLADYLHKYPNSLLTGRKPPQEKKP